MDIIWGSSTSLLRAGHETARRHYRSGRSLGYAAPAGFADALGPVRGQGGLLRGGPPGSAGGPRVRRGRGGRLSGAVCPLSLIHISEPTRLLSISYAVFCLKKKKKT